jgi:hypothetical protein
MGRWLAASAKAQEPTALRHWALRRTAWAIGNRVYDQWKRLLSIVDPTVLEVNKAVFSTTFGYGLAGVLLDPDLYDQKCIVSDVLKYRAAAMAAKLCDRLGFTDQAVEKLQNWRSLYVPEGYRPYTSLNKTLMNLPGGVPLKALERLRGLVLPRPIYDRLELLATLSATGGLADNFKAIAFADADRIKTAMQRVSQHLRRSLSPRRWRDVETAIQFMLDFPEKHNGNIVGLADKSIRWHRDNRQEAAWEGVESLGEDRALARPPVGLPDEHGVQLLETVGDLVHESRRMESCISAYAERAVHGWCFLFHVEHNGEAASVEVDRWGRVRQSLGPRNTCNSASKWGKQRLARWGRTFPKELKATR